MNKSILNDLYSKVKGRVVTKIKSRVYVSVDNEYDLINPNDIVFVFDNDKLLTCSCSSDGESLDIDDEDVQGFDMQSDGRVEVVDFSTRHPFSQILNNTLTGIAILHSELSGGDIGCSLSFEGTDVSILNLGDEIFYSSSLSNEMILDEKIIYLKLWFFKW